MHSRFFGVAFLVALSAACSTPQDAGPPTAAESELRSLKAGDFDLVQEAGTQLSPFGCRRYMKLHLTATSAALTPALDSANPQDMDPDGNCGGEELPRNITSDYPLQYIEKSACGARIYEGTIPWTESGAVTRTLQVTDSRGSRCPSAPSRVVAEVSSTYQGETHTIATYYSIDPR